MDNGGEKSKFSHLFVRPASTMGQVISILDAGAEQIALVVDSDERLLGVVTDGDIRRALIDGSTLDAPVETFMKSEFVWLPASASTEEALQQMRLQTLQHLPLLDDSRKLQRLVSLKELMKPQSLPNHVVLMAGGTGLRLRPHTDSKPKPMLDVGGRPMLQIILERCISAGLQSFSLSVGYLKEQVKDHFGDGSQWGVSIAYLEESEPLGTVGALSLLPNRPSEPLLVMNGDVLTKLPLTRLLEFHAENSADATLCVREYEYEIPFGVVNTNGMYLRSFTEKPRVAHQVSAGIYVLNPGMLDLIPAQQRLDMPALLESALARNARLMVFPVHEYWQDVGTEPALLEAIGEWA